MRRTSWSQLAVYAYLGFFSLVLVRLAAPEAIGPALRKLALAVPLVLLAAKDLAHLPDALQRLRSATGWHRRILALLPPELIGMARLDRLMWAGCLQWLRRHAPLPRPEGTALTYLQRGAYGTAIGYAMFAVFLELPLDFGIMHLFIEDPDTRLLIRVVGGIGALYTLAWVLGDRWHVAEGCHVLADDVLHLRVGVRTQGSIPLSAIERVDAVTETLDRWRRRHGIHAADTITVTPFDKPNCVLVIKPEAGVTLLHWQVRRGAPRYVLLYLDRPELLASSVGQGG
ncbi:hypothetical protein JN27_06670 [Massilia sp. BSC265]|nr:hypothetical protein JN27_06670 [Massilia sp. BSC265]